AHLFINSPSAPDTPGAAKRSMQWVRYGVPPTETGAAKCPRLVTHVETTAAPTPNNEPRPDIHSFLKGTDLLPQPPVVESGYMAAALVGATAKEYGVELCRPPWATQHWQAQAAPGFAAADFTLEWPRQQALCPAGHARRR